MYTCSEMTPHGVYRCLVLSLEGTDVGSHWSKSGNAVDIFERVTRGYSPAGEQTILLPPAGVEQCVVAAT